MRDEVGRTKSAPLRPTVFCPTSLLECLLILSLSLWGSACGLSAERRGIPSEIEATIGNITEDIAAARYEKIYNEASDLWRRDSTLEESTAVFKTIATKLGKVENRRLSLVTEQHNSGGQLKGHAYVVVYQTKFERGEGMETFTLVEQDHKWLLARYFVNSTTLQ